MKTRKTGTEGTEEQAFIYHCGSCGSLPQLYLCTRRVRSPQQRTNDPYPCCQYCQRSWKLSSIVDVWDSLSASTSSLLTSTASAPA